MNGIEEDEKFFMIQYFFIKILLQLLLFLFLIQDEMKDMRSSNNIQIIAS